MSKKGELRARLAAELLAAHARGDVRLAAGRASDFYGPGARLAAIFGDRFWQRVLAGKAGESLGDPEMKHSYSYVDDVAAGLATLGAGEAALGKVWHLPVAPAEPTRRTIERMFQALDRPAKVTALLTLVLRFAGLFRADPARGGRDGVPVDDAVRARRLALPGRVRRDRHAARGGLRGHGRLGEDGLRSRALTAAGELEHSPQLQARTAVHGPLTWQRRGASARPSPARCTL